MRNLRYLLFPVLVLLSGALAAQLHQVAIVDIPGRPGFDSMAFAKGYLVIAHRGANAVDVFDPKLRRLKAQITGMAGLGRTREQIAAELGIGVASVYRVLRVARAAAVAPRHEGDQ